MAQFSSDTRRWLEAALRQRKLLIRMNKSHKPGADVLIALDTLDRLLKAYTYSVDLLMARFICQNADKIAMILPGAGSSSFRKRNLEWNDIRYKAVQIVISEGETQCDQSSERRTLDVKTTKPYSYELEFR